MFINRITSARGRVVWSAANTNSRKTYTTVHTLRTAQARTFARCSATTFMMVPCVAVCWHIIHAGSPPPTRRGLVNLLRVPSHRVRCQRCHSMPLSSLLCQRRSRLRAQLRIAPWSAMICHDRIWVVNIRSGHSK